MGDSEKKTVFVQDEEEPLNQSLPTEEEYDLNQISDSDNDQELQVDDLEKLMPQTFYNENEYKGGYVSDDASSINTDEILKVDPLYLRLTKFLQNDDGESVANTLKKINNQLELLNTNLSNANITRN